MGTPMQMMITFQDSDGELVMTLEEPETQRHPLRRVLRYPSRLLACQHLHCIGLLAPSVAESLLTLELNGEQLSFPILIHDPKASLRGFMTYPMSPWN